MGPMVPLRMKAVLVTAVVVASSFATVVAGTPSAAGAEKSRGSIQQFLVNHHFASMITSRIAMANPTKMFATPSLANQPVAAFSMASDCVTGDAVQRTASDPNPAAHGPIYVYEMIESGALESPNYWPAPGCNAEVDISDDGNTVVASMTVDSGYGFDVYDTGSACPAGPMPTDPMDYRKTQIVMWNRPALGQSFDDPELVSEAPANPDCTYEIADAPSQGPDQFIGVGGNNVSTSPSIDDDADNIAFVSKATNLDTTTPGEAPPQGYSGLFVKRLGQFGDPEGSFQMVTPEEFEGEVLSAQISGDGNSIVFVADGDGMLSSTSEADGEQVYVIHRESDTAEWDSADIQLVSEKGGTPLFGSNNDARISGDGTRVTFVSTASVIDDDTDTDYGETNRWVVVRDVTPGAGGPARPLLQAGDEEHGYESSDSLGQPEISTDGHRLAVVARHNDHARFRFFDVDLALADTAAARADSFIDGRALTGFNRPVGLLDVTGEDQQSAYFVTFGGDGPLRRYEGSGPALYVLTDEDIGPDLTRGLHGDPVDTANGAFLQDESDLPTSRLAKFMAVQRSYSSVGERYGMFGAGWTTPMDTRLDVTDEIGRVTLELPNGRAVTYSESGGSWSTAMGYRSVLASVPDGWTVTDPNGEVWTFDEAGLLTNWSSHEGSIEIGERSTEGVPHTVTADNGDVLTLTDNKAIQSNGVNANGHDGRVDQVTTNHGVIVDYRYIRAGAGPILRSVGLPRLSTEGFAARRVYDTEGSRITAITSAGHTVVQNTYDGRGRVSHQVTESGDELTFDYDLVPNPPAGMAEAPGFTTVTNDASGDVTVYQYDADGAVIGITDALGNSVTREWDGEQPGSQTSRSGVDTAYTYDAAGRMLTATETVSGTTLTVASQTYWTADTDPDAWSDQRIATSTDAAGVTTTYTYDGDLTVPATSSVPCDDASLGAGLDCPSSGLSTTTYEYDTDGPVPLLVEQIDPDGVRTTTTYHDDETVASTTIYDEGDVPRTTTYERWYPDHAGFPFAGYGAAWADRTESPGGDVSWKLYNPSGWLIVEATEVPDELGGEDGFIFTVTGYNVDGSVSDVVQSGGHGYQSFSVARATDSDWSDRGEDPSIFEVRSTWDSAGVGTISKFDRSGDEVITEIGDVYDPIGRAVTTNTYGELGRLSTSTSPTGVITTYHYDIEGRQTGVTTGPDPDDPAHTVTTEYDSRGRVVSKTTPLGTDPDGNPVQHKVSYTYDVAGRKISQLEGSGGPAGDQLLTGYEYDDAGRLWRTVEHRHDYVDTANPITLHNADKVTETRYTLAGRTAQQVGPPVDVTAFDWSGADSTKSITSYGYDEAGRKVTVTAPDDGVTQTAYDVNGRVESTTTPGGYQTSYVYDPLGRVIETITPSGLTGDGDPATVTAKTGYDGPGNVIFQTDPHIPDPDPEVVDPSARYTEYGPGNRVESVTDANGNTVTYGYDMRGNRISRTATNDSGSPVVESWTYNLSDQELTHTVPPPRAGATSKTTTSTYDPNFGWLATVTDPTSHVQTNEYYNDGSLKQTTATRSTDAAIVKKFWLNGRGWRTKATSKNGAAATQTWSSTYDRAGQKVTETGPQGTISHSYGLAGEQLTLGYPDATTTSSYLHDPAGRLTDVSVTSGGTTIPYSQYQYDADGRQTSELVLAAGGSAARTSTYDDAGRLTTFTEVLPNTTSTWETYEADLTYRLDGRLATETINTDPTITYDYDNAGQLTSAEDGVHDRSWTYGTRGNRLTSVDSGVTTTYDTNPNGSVAKTTEGTHTVTYGYDDAGRRTSETAKTGTTTTSTTTIAYTNDNVVNLVWHNVVGSPFYQEIRGYDPDGKLIKSDTAVTGSPTTTRHYQWDTTQGVPQIIEAKNSGATWFRATWGNQRIAFKSGTASPQWFQYDARGSVIRTDPSNTDVVIGPEQYTPFGETSTAPTPDRVGYRAELTTAGLVNLRNRDYDPITGQFTTQDPLDGVDGTPVVANRHHYVDNDPLNRIDPLGLRTLDSDLCKADNGTFYEAEDMGTFCHVPAGSGEEGEPCQPAFLATGEPVVVHNGRCMRVEVTAASACNVDSNTQKFVNFAGGAISVISLSTVKLIPWFDDNTCGESNWYTAGNIGGWGVVAFVGAGLEIGGSGGAAGAAEAASRAGNVSAGVDVVSQFAKVFLYHEDGVDSLKCPGAQALWSAAATAITGNAEGAELMRSQVSALVGSAELNETCDRVS